MEFDKTMNFKVEREENTKCREVLKEVYQSLVEKGYNPINQIVGYILSGDPTYITSHNDARNKIRTIERDELLEKMVSNIVEVKSRDAFTITVTKEGTEFSEGVMDEVIEVPALEDILMPLVTVIPLQLIAYYTTVLKGLNVDKPRNLAKSVTVE